MWTPKHEALLNALRGDDVIPLLYRRLSQERYSASADEVRRLRDWTRSMSEDPAWAEIQPALESVKAWPKVWARAERAGFSPRTDHHSALVLRDLATRFATDRDYHGARRSFAWHIQAYRRVFASDYPVLFVEDVAPKVDGWSVEDVFGSIFEDDVQWLEHEANESLIAARVDAGRLDFAGGCLEHLASLEPPEADCFGAMKVWSNAALSAKVRLVDSAIRQFDQGLEGLDLAQASDEDLAAPFERLSAVFKAFGPIEKLLVHTVDETVETLWRLRHVGRDESDGFRRILAVTAPLNAALAAALDRGETFGHNSKCADFLVFQAELLDEHAMREDILKRALVVCPGHRNSLMLLSYVYLHEADIPLSQLTALPTVTQIMPRKQELCGRFIEQVEDAIEKAENVYAFNKSLSSYKERLQTQRDRLKVGDS